jgi:HK97 family phage portal protein
MTTRTVTDETAMQLSAVFACVRIISETVAGLPISFYKVKKNARGKIVSKDLANDYPLYRLLNWRPNRYMTRVEFLETIMSQLAFRGNAYCAIERSSNGQIISLLPMMTSQTEVVLEKNGDVVYKYTDGNNLMFLAEKNVWHLKLFGNGIVGLSPLDQARNSLGIAISAEDRVNKMANSGFKAAGVLTIDKVLKPEQRIAIKKNFQDLQDGGDDTLRVLEAGMQYQQISMNPRDVQLLESRKFQTEDIARFFGVPSVLINDMSASTVWGSGITEIIRGWYKLGLKPYTGRTENSISVRLIDIADRETIVPEFDFDELLRGDEKSRYEGYQVAIRNGIKSPNECREDEGLSPDPSGDHRYIDRQLIYLENGGLPNEQKTTAPADAGKV